MEISLSRRTPASTRLAVEALEDRTVPGFLAPVTSPGGGDALALADLNHDLFADAVVISSNKSVSVSLGNGDGTFRDPIRLRGAGGTLYWVGVRDVNADGHPDVVANGHGKDLTAVPDGMGGHYHVGTRYDNVWLGDGHGAFGPVQTTSTWTSLFLFGPFIYNPNSTRGDFNGDGIVDDAGFNTSVGTVVVWLGNADGTSQAPRFYAAGPSPGSIAAGDLNGDGRTDLVVVNKLGSGKPTLTVLLNDGNW